MYGVPALPTLITYKGMILSSAPPSVAASRLANSVKDDPGRANVLGMRIVERFTAAYDSGGCVPSDPRPLPTEVILDGDRTVLSAFGIIAGLYPIPLPSVDPRVSGIATRVLDRISEASKRYRVRCASHIPLPPPKAGSAASTIPGTPACAPGFVRVMVPTCKPAPTPDDYGFIGTSWRAYNKMIPKNPQLSMEENPPRLCLDLKSEQALQNQRKFAMDIGGPAVFLAGNKLKGFFGTFVMGLGVACTAWHYTSYKKVSEITGIK